MMMSGLTPFFRSAMQANVIRSGTTPGMRLSRIVCTVVVTCSPALFVYDESTSGMLTVVHFATSAPMTRRPRTEEPSVR